MDSDILGDLRSEADPYLGNFDEDKKSRFTEYSSTSSVMRRHAQLSLLDDRFEQVISETDSYLIKSVDVTFV